jgi:hypothetical protein
MKAFKLVGLCVASVLASVLITQAPALAQAPGTVAAGQYHNTTLMAGFFASSTSGDLNITVTDKTNVASPAGGPSTTTHTTSVFIEAFGGSLFGQGCYDLAPSDFTFSTSAAALHASITDTTGTCGGPPGTFPTPFSVDMTWTGTGPVQTQRGGSQLHCGGYGLETTSSSTINSASATGTVSPIFTDQFTGDSQLLRSDDEVLHAQGVSPDACQPFGAIAGGAGPPPAGEYTNARSDISIFFFSDTGPSLGISVTNATQTSSPKGGPSTTTREFDVRVNIFGGGVFGFGCFNLTPSDFSSNGALGATLNMTITDATPTCQGGGGPGSLPLPQTLNVVWSGIGPVATTRSTGHFNCLTYRSEGEGVNVTNLANVTASLTPFLSAPMTSSQGSLATSASHLHTEGAQQPACRL